MLGCRVALGVGARIDESRLRPPPGRSSAGAAEIDCSRGRRTRRSHDCRPSTGALPTRHGGVGELLAGEAGPERLQRVERLVLGEAAQVDAAEDLPVELRRGARWRGGVGSARRGGGASRGRGGARRRAATSRTMPSPRSRKRRIRRRSSRRSRSQTNRKQSWTWSASRSKRWTTCRISGACSARNSAHASSAFPVGRPSRRPEVAETSTTRNSPVLLFLNPQERWDCPFFGSE